MNVMNTNLLLLLLSILLSIYTAILYNNTPKIFPMDKKHNDNVEKACMKR